MLYSQTGPELMTLDGPYPEYRLMSQGLTAARIEAEGRIDSRPGADAVVEPGEIDDIISKLPRIDLIDAAAFIDTDGFEKSAMGPDYSMNIWKPELAIVCYGLRVVHRAARLQRVTLGGWSHEVARRLDEQIDAYDTLSGQLSGAMRAFR
jgi:hypothetical protein